jgi:outer membrane lipoprotein-sorting protein
MKLLITILALSLASTAFALTPAQAGLAIAKNMQKANKGFVGEKSEMELVLIDAKGTRVTRVLKGMTKEIAKDGDKSISIFLNPKDVKGTKMLTHSHKVGDDDQWLFLPSLRKVKRISSRSKSSSFMASEFSYEDLGSQEIDKYNFKLLKNIKGGWVLQRVPKEKSGYSKMKTYISKKYMSSVKVEYFDRKKELLKVATFSNWKQYKVGKKKLWRAGKIHMKNVQTKKESIFTWKKRKIGVKHADRLFRKSALK